MKPIVVLVATVIGSHFCGIDFCTLYTVVSIALDIYERYSENTHDKTAKR